MVAGISRPRGSTLWDYFEYNEDENKSVCTVTTTEGLQCLIKIAGKFPTNLCKHLGKSHSEAFKESEKKDEEKKHGECQSEKAKKSKCPPGVLQPACQPYDNSSACYHSISRKLSILIGTCNVPNYLVTTAKFQEFVNELNPRYVVPGRTAMNKELDLLLQGLKGKICKHLDTWTKKGMSESFLGVTAHFFLRKSHKHFKATLAVRRISTTHSRQSARCFESCSL